ncbi:MAG: CPBP family glutamic-type intramembrane protease [Myxococcota bacterium]
MAEDAKKRSSGWGPYWYPMLAFLLLVEIGARAPEVLQPLFLTLKVAAPLGFFTYFWLRGAYPELRGARWGALAVADIVVGLVGAGLWMVPLVAWDSLRPEDAGFDRFQLGEAGVAVTLAIRGVGYFGVTPFVEELFVRSWLMRFVEVFDRKGDFRKVPIAKFGWRSFIVVMIYFVFSHVSWEWGIMFGWSLLTMLWFYYRKHLAPLVLVHAVTNGAIFFFVLLFDEQFTDSAGEAISLWFFL